MRSRPRRALRPTGAAPRDGRCRRQHIRRACGLESITQCLREAQSGKASSVLVQPSGYQVPLGRYPLLEARAGEPRRAAARYAQARDLFAGVGAQPFLPRYREDFADHPPCATVRVASPSRS